MRVQINKVEMEADVVIDAAGPWSLHVAPVMLDAADSFDGMLTIDIRGRTAIGAREGRTIVRGISAFPFTVDEWRAFTLVGTP